MARFRHLLRLFLSHRVLALSIAGATLLESKAFAPPETQGVIQMIVGAMDEYGRIKYTFEYLVNNVEVGNYSIYVAPGSEVATTGYINVAQEFQGQRISYKLYAAAMDSAPMKSVNQINSAWAETNMDAFNRARDRGLPWWKAAEEVPAAKGMTSKGWYVASYDGYTSVTYKKPGPHSPLSLKPVAQCKVVPQEVIAPRSQSNVTAAQKPQIATPSAPSVPNAPKVMSPYITVPGQIGTGMAFGYGGSVGGDYIDRCMGGRGYEGANIGGWLGGAAAEMAWGVAPRAALTNPATATLAVSSYAAFEPGYVAMKQRVVDDNIKINQAIQKSNENKPWYKKAPPVPCAAFGPP